MNSIQAQLMFNALGSYDRKMPRFREGQIFHGTVLKLLPNDLALIAISRTPVVAKLEVSLQLGSEYWFVVKKNSDTPMLHVLTATSPNGQHEQSVQNLLRHLDLPPTPTNISLISHLKNEGILFTKTFIKTAASLLENVKFEHGVEVLKIMLDRKLPLNEQIFQSIYRFFTADKSLFTQLQQITNLLQANSHIPLQAHQLNEQLVNILNGWKTIHQNIDEAVTSNQHAPIRELISMLGLQHEKAVFQFLNKQLSHQELTVQSQDVKSILLALLKETIPNQTKQMIQDAVFRLTGQQLLMKLDEPFLQFLLQIPIPKELANDDAVLQFESKNRGGQIDTDFCRIIFYLQLNKLRETVIDVQIQNRVINVTVYNDINLSDKQLKPFITVFQHQIEQKNYRLSSVKWVNASKIDKRKNVHEIFLNPISRYKGVDIKI